MSNGIQECEISSTPTRPMLVQVVPRLRPGKCGVSDQAILLAGELDTAFEIDSAFAVLNSEERATLQQAAIYCPPSKLLESCIEFTKGQSGAILVHVSGYGYSADGAPALLADALEKVRESSRFRIAAYFHELFVVAPPWKSGFWSSRRQQKAVRAIAEVSDLLVTNTRYHADWLERQFAQPSTALLRLLPVFSAAGEALEPAPFGSRDPVMAVFGLPGSRQRAYDQLQGLGKILDHFGIRQFIDIGPTLETPADVNGIPVKRLGKLSVADLGRLLSSSMFGFVGHPPSCLAKSSIFASYCAQGVIPVVAKSFRGEVDGLTDGMHVVSPMTAASAAASGWEACSRAAWNWYITHRLRVHAEQYAKWMSEPA